MKKVFYAMVSWDFSLTTFIWKKYICVDFAYCERIVSLDTLPHIIEYKVVFIYLDANLSYGRIMDLDQGTHLYTDSILYALFYTAH